MNREKLENFEDAFHAGTGGCLRSCNCGRIYYDAVSPCDWEEGEIERLDTNEEATGCEHSISDLRINGVEYVMSCDCWHKKAEELMSFIDKNAYQIAKYLNAEKTRKQRDAEHAPSIG
jgi:hypothetical protein